VASTAHGPATVVDVDGIDVRLTSPDKPVFDGISKRTVFEYYLTVGARLVDQIGGRPTALERWPEGVTEAAEHFYQKHLPTSVPDYVHGVRVRFPSGRPGVLLNPDSRAAIGWAVQMGALTFHAWPVREPAVEQPDQLRIDLDPPDGRDFDSVAKVALACREVITEWGFTGYLKTSGGRGLHIFVPVIPTHSFVDVRHGAIAIGREVERRLPDLVTMSWWKEEREGKVFIDFNQNAQDRVMASAYSIRPRPKAPVSMPIAWADLDGVRPEEFTVRTVPNFVATLPDPWRGMQDTAVGLRPALDAWDRDVAAGLPELPYPPDFPKMPGEPPRVQPSRARQRDDE
jgi:DNA ligase D